MKINELLALEPEERTDNLAGLCVKGGDDESCPIREGIPENYWVYYTGNLKVEEAEVCWYKNYHERYPEWLLASVQYKKKPVLIFQYSRLEAKEFHRRIILDEALFRDLMKEIWVVCSPEFSLPTENFSDLNEEKIDAFGGASLSTDFDWLRYWNTRY